MFLLDLQARKKPPWILNTHPWKQVRKSSRSYTIKGIISAQKREEKGEEKEGF
jgi:hypothetical protein